jgi:hypothetical protein
MAGPGQVIENTINRARGIDTNSDSLKDKLFIKKHSDKFLKNNLRRQFKDGDSSREIGKTIDNHRRIRAQAGDYAASEYPVSASYVPVPTIGAMMNVNVQELALVDYNEGVRVSSHNFSEVIQYYRNAVKDFSSQEYTDYLLYFSERDQKKAFERANFNIEDKINEEWNQILEWKFN